MSDRQALIARLNDMRERWTRLIASQGWGDLFDGDIDNLRDAAAALVFVLVLEVAADEGFVYLNDAEQLQEFPILHRHADAMAHVPRGFVGAEAERAEDLQRADAFLARHHHMDDAEPILQRFVGVLEDGSDRHGEAIGRLVVAVVALPVKVFGAVLAGFKAAARAADNASRPAVLGQIRAAGVFIREVLGELVGRQLVDSVVRRLGILGHGWLPLNVGALCHG